MRPGGRAQLLRRQGARVTPLEQMRMDVALFGFAMMRTVRMGDGSLGVERVAPEDAGPGRWVTPPTDLTAADVLAFARSVKPDLVYALPEGVRIDMLSARRRPPRGRAARHLRAQARRSHLRALQLSRRTPQRGGPCSR